MDGQRNSEPDLTVEVQLDEQIDVPAGGQCCKKNMKITRINASGLKGKAFDHTLTKPNTVFIGANGSGKSSRLDAVQLALFGTHPSLGKTNESTIRISSGTELVVGAHHRAGPGSSWTRLGQGQPDPRAELETAPTVAGQLAVGPASPEAVEDSSTAADPCPLWRGLRTLGP